MNVEIVAKDVMVNDEVHGRVEKKLEKILEHSHKQTPVRVALGNSRGRYMAHITMTVKGKDIVAQAENRNMLAAIDDAMEKADRQFKKHHEKILSRRQAGVS